MAKHVSEPWHYHVDTVGRNPEIVITKKNGDIVADIGGGELTDRISNARLIAAAPALLAACESMIAVYAPLYSPTEVTDAFSSAVIKARAAIAAARG